MSSKLCYIPQYGTGANYGSENSVNSILSNSVEGVKNELHVLIREHVQNSLDAYDKRNPKPEKLIFNVSRKKIDGSFFQLDKLKQIYKDCLDYKKTQVGEHSSVNKSIIALNKAYESIDKNKSKDIWSIIIEDNGCGLDGDTRVVEYNKIKQTAALILDEGDTNKYGAERGAYGVGKLTAFTNNDTYTVFYLNSKNNKYYLIGKTILESYATKNSNAYGPSIFFGERKKDKKNMFDFADWTEIKDPNIKNKLRVIEGDGLTTIIPSFKIEENSEWLKEVAYTIIHSYFRVFEENQIECTVFDEYTNKKITIDINNYKELYESFENLEYLQNSDIDMYNYLLVRPFVTNESMYECKKIEDELTVTNLYKGTVIYHIYKNPFLQDLIDKLKKANYSKTFRFLRKNMLLRAHQMPGVKLLDPNFCGYVEFKEDDPDFLNNILIKGETKSHDSIDFKNYDDTTEKRFPGKSTLNTKFFAVINRKIKDEVEKLSDLTSNENDEHNVDLGFIDGFNDKNKNPTFSRYVIDPELYKKLTEVNASGLSDGTKKAGDLEDDYVGENIEGSPGTIIKKGRIGPSRGGSKTSGGGKNKTPSFVDKGIDSGERKKELSSISFLTKIISKDRGNHEYLIKIFNVNSEINISLSQESHYGESRFLTFVIKGAEINGNNYYDYTERKTNSYISSYFFEKIKPINNSITICLVVKEPTKTETKFKLILS